MSLHNSSRVISYFTHNGEDYKIMCRVYTGSLHGYKQENKYIVRRSDDKQCGEANNVKEARKVLDARCSS